jgi:hypothetical protein
VLYIYTLLGVKTRTRKLCQETEGKKISYQYFLEKDNKRKREYITVRT